MIQRTISSCQVHQYFTAVVAQTNVDNLGVPGFDLDQLNSNPSLAAAAAAQDNYSPSGLGSDPFGAVDMCVNILARISIL